MKEWERRWRLKNDSYPKDKVIKTIHITQYRLNKSPYVRVRESIIDNESTYTHCVKYGVEEVEIGITKRQYDYISSLSKEKPIVKDRIEVDLDNGLIAEVDHFLEEDEWIVEVEFSSKKAMDSYVAPDWFGEELEKGVMFNSISEFLALEALKRSVWI